MSDQAELVAAALRYRLDYATPLNRYRAGVPAPVAEVLGALSRGPHPWIWRLSPRTARRLEVGATTPPRLQIWAGCRRLNELALTVARQTPTRPRAAPFWGDVIDRYLGDPLLGALALAAARELGPLTERRELALLDAPDDVLRSRVAIGALGTYALGTVLSVAALWRGTSPALTNPYEGGQK